jgi:hypothetical protein
VAARRRRVDLGVASDSGTESCRNGIEVEVNGFPGGDESRRNALGLATLAAYIEKRG